MKKHSGLEFFGSYTDEILKDFDAIVARTKEKHFVVVNCVNAKKYTGNVPGKAFQFIFLKVDSPELRKLDYMIQETILDTKLNNDVCFVVVGGDAKLTILKYERSNSPAFN